MHLLKLGMLSAFRDLVWRKHEAENIFSVASLQHSWCQAKELHSTLAMLITYLITLSQEKKLSFWRKLSKKSWLHEPWVQ